MRRELLLIVALGGAACGASADEIYKSVDSEGRVTYSNVPSKGAKKVDLPPVMTFPGVKPPAAAPSAARAEKQGTDAEKKRLERRTELEEKLAAELKLLDEARRALKEGEETRLGDERHNYQKYLDRVQQLKDDVARHEQNVATLKQELEGLK